jgi:hypothetical protein
LACVLGSLSASLAAQSKRLWVLRAPGEAVEYDASHVCREANGEGSAGSRDLAQRTFPVNHLGQMLFAAPAVFAARGRRSRSREKSLVLGWSHRTTLTREVARTTATAGSNLAITESAPVPYLSEDGAHLYWFSNQARRLQRDGVDLSTKTTWLSWQTDPAGGARQEVASITLPDCPCPHRKLRRNLPLRASVGSRRWGGKFFLLTQFVSGKLSLRTNRLPCIGKCWQWAAAPINPPLKRVLDAANAGVNPGGDSRHRLLRLVRTRATIRLCCISTARR